ncbi:C4-type zinc ribbon domain-containing protein, partial [Flavobacteriales bacterium]|nr:C4-type zinc ribbon domain-containing protein [Flavobacteriales bacterium]
EIQIAEKNKIQNQANVLHKTEIINACTAQITEKQEELKIKQSELDEIIKETEKEEVALMKDSVKAEKVIDERLLNAYKRIRSKVSNGLAVVSVERDACGGCFSHIPPQRQLDIQMHKKVIVCEHCGRIMVDSNIFEE